MKKNRRSPLFRSNKGSFLAENAGVTVALFIGFVFPFIDLATVGLRYSFLMRSVHDAAHVGAGASTFSSGSSSYNVMDSVQATMKSSMGATGVNISKTDVNIVTTAFTTNKVIVNAANVPLPSGKIPGSNPAADYPSVDPSSNNYAIQVTATAKIDPLITVNFGFFPNVPGLTGPYNCSVSSQELSETPSNLTQ